MGILTEAALIGDPLNPRRLARSPVAGLRLEENDGGDRRSESRRARVYVGGSWNKGATRFKGKIEELNFVVDL
jgi:hypothetical protein